jgi:hypothetical protein
VRTRAPRVGHRHRRRRRVAGRWSLSLSARSVGRRLFSVNRVRNLAALIQQACSRSLSCASTSCPGAYSAASKDEARDSASCGEENPFTSDHLDGRACHCMGQVSHFTGQVSHFEGQVIHFMGQVSHFMGQVSHFVRRGMIREQGAGSRERQRGVE